MLEFTRIVNTNPNRTFNMDNVHVEGYSKSSQVYTDGRLEYRQDIEEEFGYGTDIPGYWSSTDHYTVEGASWVVVVTLEYKGYRDAEKEVVLYTSETNLEELEKAINAHPEVARILKAG